MNEVQLKMEPGGKGAFFIGQDDNRQAEMTVFADEKNLTVYHTQVSPALKGTHAGTQLLNSMVAYARSHDLKVIALCPFVSSQFKKYSDQYSDVWNQHWH